MKTFLHLLLLITAVLFASLRPAIAIWETDGSGYEVSSPAPVTARVGSAQTGKGVGGGYLFSVDTGAQSFWPPLNPMMLPSGYSSATVDVYYGQRYKWVGGGTPTSSFSVTTNGEVSGEASLIANPAGMGPYASASSYISTISNGGNGPSAGGSAPATSTDPDYQVLISSYTFSVANGSLANSVELKFRLRSYSTAAQSQPGAGYSAESLAQLEAPEP
jgi:hypothetical protein